MLGIKWKIIWKREPKRVYKLELWSISEWTGKIKRQTKSHINAILKCVLLECGEEKSVFIAPAFLALPINCFVHISMTFVNNMSNVIFNNRFRNDNVSGTRYHHENPLSRKSHLHIKLCDGIFQNEY